MIVVAFPPTAVERGTTTETTILPSVNASFIEAIVGIRNE